MFQDATQNGIVTELITKHGMSLASDIEQPGQVYKETDGVFCKGKRAH